MDLVKEEISQFWVSNNPAKLGTACGLGTSPFLLRASHSFVEDYRDLAQYNDPPRPDKYAPNVVGFFCVNMYTQKLLPVEIRLLDTKLTYTSYDSKDEWTLAKMALEAASVSYHQVQHMVETHAVTNPLRVEAMRTMSVHHPVRALLQRHVFADFGLEMQVAVLLLNTSTLLDKTFDAVPLRANAERAFGQARRLLRGLDNIPRHKYVAYGALYWTAIRNFVDANLNAYYAANRSVVSDMELQNWAKASTTIPHVIPIQGTSARLLTHLIFTCTVRHHGMNGAATWHGMSAPYAPAALWKPLPSAKRIKLNLLEYTVPTTTVLPGALARGLGPCSCAPCRRARAFFGAYKAEPFASEAKLQSAISAFDAALRDIETTLQENEADSKWPFLLLSPSRMPHYTGVETVSG